MKYAVVTTQVYRKSLRRLSRSGSFARSELDTVVELLGKGDILPLKYRDHALTGNLRDFRECHIRPDLLLIYTKDEGILVLVLVNIGSHATLLKK